MAIATETGHTNSSVASAAYTITATAATPTFSPAAGTYSAAQSVTISTATSGATICYTTNGTTPAAGTPGTCSTGSSYSGPVSVASSETLRAIATKTGYTNSSVASAAYTINQTGLAQTYDGLTMPTTHPRLFGFNNSTTLANARTWWSANYPTFTPGTCDDNHPFNCEMIAFGHLMTANQGTPISCSAAITWAYNWATIAGGPSSSGNSQNTQNALNESLIAVYDWCYDQMTTTQRSSFVSGYSSTWGGPYNSGSPGGTSNFVCGNGISGNLCWGELRGAFMWGVASYWDNTDSNANAQANLDEFFNNWTTFKNYEALYGVGGGAGGINEEGVAYGATLYGAGGPLFPIVTSRALGRDLLTETNWWNEAAFALIYETTPSATYTSRGGGVTQYEVFPFNDVESSCPGTCLLAQSEIYNVATIADVLSNYYSTTNLGKYLRTWLNTLTASQIAMTPYVAAEDAGSSALSYSTLPLDYYAPGSGFFYGRKAWDTSSTIAHLELNTSSEVGHYHPWAGSWANVAWR